MVPPMPIRANVQPKDQVSIGIQYWSDGLMEYRVVGPPLHCYIYSITPFY